VTPELALGYLRFADVYARDTLQILGGGRVALPGTLEPSLYLHLGWGKAHGVDVDAVLDRSGLTLEAGAGVDLRLGGRWILGVALAYNTLRAETGSGTDVAHWLSLGVHGGVEL
jgi:hypothetical protein